MNQHPGAYDPGTPPYTPASPPRRGAPWWMWVLGGCGGCAVIVIIAFVAMTVWGVNTFRNTAQSVGPITEASVRQSLGQEVPLYPDAALDTMTTRTMLTSFRMVERMAGKPPGEIFKGLAVLHTDDPAVKVLQFYEKRLPQAGWKRAKASGAGSEEQHLYQKGQEMVMVQAQPNTTGGGTMVILTRGGPAIANQMPQPPGTGGR